MSLETGTAFASERELVRESSAGNSLAGSCAISGVEASSDLAGSAAVCSSAAGFCGEQPEMKANTRKAVIEMRHKPRAPVSDAVWEVPRFGNMRPMTRFIPFLTWNDTRLFISCFLMPEPSKRATTALLAVFIVLAIVAVYGPVVGFDFTNYDDADYVTNNPPVRAGLTWAGIQWAFTHSHSANWHPLTWISHMCDCSLYGLRAGGHHTTNLLLHIANSLLVFALLRELTGAVWRSGLVAGLFALHPMHVESVAWIAERKDVLSGFFGLLSLWAYARFCRGRGNESQLGEAGLVGQVTRVTRRAVFYWLSLLFLALGLLSKPMLVTWPFVMLLLDFWPLGRFKGPESRRVVILEKVPFLLLAIGSAVVTFLVQKSAKAISSLAQTSLGDRLINTLVSYFLYVWKLFWPSRLAVLYPKVVHWSAGLVVGAAVLLLGVTGLVLWQRKERPWLFTGWAWFLGTLVPVVGLVKVGSHSIANRYTYLPSIGLFLMVVWAAAELWNRVKGASRETDGSAFCFFVPSVACAVLLVPCALAAQREVYHWQNTLRLFTRTLAVTRENYLAWTSLAFDFSDFKELNQAESCLQNALRIYPAFEEGWTKLASVRLDQHRVEEAQRDCKNALQLNPISPGAHSTLGLAYVKQGKTNDALAEYSEALKNNPGFASAHYNLANLLAAQGKFSDAREHYEASLRTDPYSADAHNNLAYMLVRTGDLTGAVAQFRAALELEPRSWHARYGLGDTLMRLKAYDAATEELRLVIIQKPDFLSARLQLGLALVTQGKMNQAIAEFAEAAKLNPESALAHYQLAAALLNAGKMNEALGAARKAAELARGAGQEDLARRSEELVRKLGTEGKQ